MRIKTNDTVLVIAGKDKGKKGKVIRSLRQKDRVVVEKVSIVKKHIKKTKEKSGERIEFESAIHISNVQIICPSCSKLTRVKMQISKSGKKIRTCKKCDSSLEQKFIKS